MIRSNKAKIIGKLLSLVVLLSVITIYGVIWNIPYLKLIGLIIIALSVVLPITFVDILNTALLTFIVTLIPMLLSLSYELISEYPLGEDIHSEYFIIKNLQIYTQLSEIQKEAQTVFGIPGYYSEILNSIFSSNIISEVLGSDPLYVIKFLWNSLILGLLPLIIFIYTYYLMEDKKSAVIASILIAVQSTYIITLHSTAKQVTSMFLATIMALLILRTLKHSEVRKDFPAVIILAIGLTGYHYLTSGATFAVFFMGLAIHYFVATLFKSKSQGLHYSPRSLKITSYVVLSFILIWITWYFVIFKSLIEPVVDLTIRLFTLEKAEYYYEKINVPLPAFINVLRLGINGIIALDVIVSGIMAFMNINRGNVVDSLIVASSALFFLGTVSEFLGISTIGIGRVSIIFLMFVAPYFYNAFSLITRKLGRIPKKNTLIALLLVSLILTTRLLISVGVMSYTFGHVENSVFMDPNHKYITSLTYADLRAAEFIINKSANKIYIGTDPIGKKPFIYVCTETCNIAFVNYFASLNKGTAPLYPIYFIFLSSYNIVGRTIQISVTEFKSTDEYLPYINSTHSLIYGNGFTYIYF
jgi:uncharacterized membrane protein